MLDKIKGYQLKSITTTDSLIVRMFVCLPSGRQFRMLIAKQACGETHEHLNARTLELVLFSYYARVARKPPRLRFDPNVQICGGNCTYYSKSMILQVVVSLLICEAPVSSFAQRNYGGQIDALDLGSDKSHFS